MKCQQVLPWFRYDIVSSCTLLAMLKRKREPQVNMRRCPAVEFRVLVVRNTVKLALQVRKVSKVVRSVQDSVGAPASRGVPHRVLVHFARHAGGRSRG